MTRRRRQIRLRNYIRYLISIPLGVVAAFLAVLRNRHQQRRTQ